MANTVKLIVVHEHANTVCAICRKNGKLAQASALRTWGIWHQWYVCAGHAERAEGWDRVEAAS